MTRYALPDGFQVEARGEADSDWNSWPVPILSPDEHARLVKHAQREASRDRYEAEYVDDGKVTPGFYADGLQWARVDEDER